MEGAQCKEEDSKGREKGGEEAGSEEIGQRTSKGRTKGQAKEEHAKEAHAKEEHADDNYNTHTRTHAHTPFPQQGRRKKRVHWPDPAATGFYFYASTNLLTFSSQEQYSIEV